MIPAGKKNKQNKKGRPKDEDKTLDYADNQETFYAIAERPYGDGRYHCLCSDREARMGTLRGSIARFTAIRPGDYVLVSLRSFESKKEGKLDKCDILKKYTPDDIRLLKREGRLLYKDSTQTFELRENKPDATSGGSSESPDGSDDEFGVDFI